MQVDSRRQRAHSVVRCIWVKSRSISVVAVFSPGNHVLALLLSPCLFGPFPLFYTMQNFNAGYSQHLVRLMQREEDVLAQVYAWTSKLSLAPPLAL